MSDVMLHAVLNMEPLTWSGDVMDETQRHARYVEASKRIESLQDIIQMCFDDSCKPSGRLTKKTVLKLMKYADCSA